MNRSVLILGGTGFLGQKIARRFVGKKEFSIVCAGSNKTKIKGIKTIKVDILNKEILKKAIKDYDIIINCTGQITEPIDKCLKLNTEGIENIVQCIKNTNKVLFHISTVVVYGSSKRVDENSALNPDTPYGISKLFSEYLIISSLKLQQYEILRLSNLYGSINQKSGIFAYLYKSFKTNKKLVFENDWKLSRYYLNVNDCAAIIFELVLKPPYGGVYNIIGGKQYSIKELISLLENSIKMSFKVKYVNYKPISNIGYISDKKLSDKIKFRYKHSVENYFKEYFR